MKLAIPFFAVALVLVVTPKAEAQSRSGHMHPQQSTPQAVIQREMQCLTNTGASLEQSFSDHLRRNRPRPSRAELDFSASLHELNDDIKHLADDLRAAQSINHVYRTFHMLDYSVQNSWALAAQAGYARSLNGWLMDIDDHVSRLAEQGLRNPRFQEVQMDNRYHSQYRSQQADVQFAPVPMYDERGNRINIQQPISSAVRPGPIPSSGDRPRDGEIRINLGEALGRLFGRK